MLQRPKLQGGLALPNLCHYYWATNVQKIIYWLHTPDTDWCHFEATFCISTSLRVLVTSSLPLPISQYINNPIIVNTLRIWFQLRRHFGFKGFLHTSPIHNSHLFPPVRLFKDMYINCIFASFNDLSHKFSLPRSSLFRNFQVSHFLQCQNTSFPRVSPLSG